MNTRKERINGIREECDGQWCGYPMFQGDHVIVDDRDRTFCSKRCAGAYDDAENRRILGATAHRVEG
mgnify:CR=1 FL=1